MQEFWGNSYLEMEGTLLNTIMVVLTLNLQFKLFPSCIKSMPLFGRYSRCLVFSGGRHVPRWYLVGGCFFFFLNLHLPTSATTKTNVGYGDTFILILQVSFTPLIGHFLNRKETQSKALYIYSVIDCVQQNGSGYWHLVGALSAVLMILVSVLLHAQEWIPVMYWGKAQDNYCQWLHWQLSLFC